MEALRNSPTLPLSGSKELSLPALIAHWAEHGKSVNAWYLRLAEGFEAILPKEPALQAWFASYTFKDLSAYHLNHDCAKPFCAVFDAQTQRYSYGRNHSEKSAALAAILGVDAHSCHLIANDMAFHLARENTIQCAWALKGSEDLYATAWAELFANAALFEGEHSDSFKMKKKRLLWALKHRPCLLSNTEPTPSLGENHHD